MGVKNRRNMEMSERDEYLNVAMSFYAEYVMGSSKPENISKVKGWLDKKVEQNKR